MTGHRSWDDVRGDLHRHRLDAVPLDVDDEGATYVPLRGVAPDGGDVRLYLDRHAGTDREARYPLTLVGDLGAELTTDEARDLAYALLALLRRRARRALTAGHVPGTVPETVLDGPALLPFLTDEELP